MPENVDTMRSDISLDVVILCGGLGTRLQSVLPGVPKPMAPVGGRPFLEWVLMAVGRSMRGCRVILCAGPQPDAIREVIRDGRRFGLDLVYAEEPDRVGTGGAIRRARTCLRSDPVMVWNGDTWCDIDLPHMVAWHRARCAKGTIALTQIDDADRFGSVRCREDGTILAFREKCGGGGPGWINAGIYVLTRELIDSIPGGPVSLEREILPRWVGRGLCGYRKVNRFLDIGTPESYRQAEQLFSHDRFPRTEASLGDSEVAEQARTMLAERST